MCDWPEYPGGVKHMDHCSYLNAHTSFGPPLLPSLARPENQYLELMPEQLSLLARHEQQYLESIWMPEQLSLLVLQRRVWPQAPCTRTGSGNPDLLDITGNAGT